MCINVVVCEYGMIYVLFINGLICVGIEVDCKVLFDLVICELDVFKVIVDKVWVVV